MVLSFLFHVFPLPFRFLNDVSGHAAPRRPGPNGVHGGYGQGGTSDMFLCVDWSIGQWHFKKKLSWYIMIYIYILYIYILPSKNWRFFSTGKPYLRWFWLIFDGQIPYKTRVSPRLAQSIHRCRPGYGPGYGQPGRQFGPTGSPRGYGAGPWRRFPTTRLPFGNLTVRYGKPSFILIYIYI
jgi:hypothetical protein